jgi:hypothetical protein
MVDTAADTVVVSFKRNRTLCTFEIKKKLMFAFLPFLLQDMGMEAAWDTAGVDIEEVSTPAS